MCPFWILFARLLGVGGASIGIAAPGLAQLTITRTPATAAADLGKVAEGSATTTFTVEPWSSTVSRSPDNSTGHLRFDTAPLSLPSVTVTCTTSACVGYSNAVVLRVSKVSADARITLSKWDVGAFAYTSSGMIIAPISVGTELTWALVFNSVGSKATFNIGQTMAISATGTNKTLDLSYRVTAGVGSAPTTGGVTGTVRTIMYRPISIAKNTNLVFGQVKRPPSGTGHVIISPAATTTRTSDGGVGLITDTSVSAAKFTISGEGAASISVAVPASITLYGSRGGTMTLIPSGSGTGSTSLSGAAGTAGTKVSYVGGSLAIDSEDPTGSYTGTLTVTASYN